MRHISVKLLAILAIIALAACQKLSDNTVAKVGRFEITADDYKNQLSRRFGQKESYAEVDSAVKRDILNRMIEEKLYLNEAYDRGLNNAPEIKDELKRQIDASIGNKFYERNVVDKLISEKELRDTYEKNKIQVRASHVLIAYKGARRGRAKRSKKEAKRLADQVYRMAKAGKSIETLAEKYSDDPSAKQNKGDLGYFSWGRMAPAFQEKAFSQEKGEISEPVLTSFGYHIIKTVDKRENPDFNADNFEQEKNRLKHRLYRKVQGQARVLWDSLSNSLKKQSNFVLNEENIKKVSSLIKEKAKTKKIKTDDFSDTEKSIILASWDGGKCTLGCLFEYYGQRLSQYTASLTTPDKLKEKVDNFSLNKIVIDLAKKEGYENDPEVQKEIENAKRSIERKMIRKVQYEMLKDEGEITEDEMKAYYEKHKDSFKKKAEIETWEIYVTNEDLAKKIAEQAKNGADFEKLVEKYSEDKYTKKKKGYLGFIKSFSRGAVSKEAIKAGSNAVAGPIKYKKGWAIIKTGLEKPEVLKSFEESKKTVRSKLKREKRAAHREQIKKDLWNSYSVKINEQLIGKI
jgi:parvulin-like peptidyl-prolyl isomerase